MDETQNNNKPSENILNEGSPRYGFVHRSEMEKSRENVFRSDKEKLMLFTRMIRRNAMFKKAIIHHHK
jgi:hypothetical protein